MINFELTASSFKLRMSKNSIHLAYDVHICYADVQIRNFYGKNSNYLEA